MSSQPSFMVVAGDEGNANAGDQAMFLGLVHHVRAHWPEAHITSLSRHPDRVLPTDGVDRCYDWNDYLTERNRLTRLIETHLTNGTMIVLGGKALMLLASARLMKLGIKPFIVGKSARRLLELVEKSDLVLSCGGGYLNSIWRYESLWPSCIVYRIGAALGRPVCLTGQGIGPISYRMDRRALKWGLKYVKHIGLRDSGDGSDLLRSVGIPNARLTETGDDAVELPVCSDDELRRVCHVEGIPTDKPLIAAQFRPTSHTGSFGKEYGILASALDAVIERYGFHVVFVPIAHDESCDDRMAAFGVSMRMRHRAATSIVTGYYRPEVTKALIGLGRVSFGASYHFGIFSLTQGVPMFGFYANEYYRLKFRGMYGHFGSPDWCFPFETVDPEAVAERIGAVIDDLPRIKADLLRHTDEMAARVNSSYAQVAQYLKAEGAVGGRHG